GEGGAGGGRALEPSPRAAAAWLLRVRRRKSRLSKSCAGGVRTLSREGEATVGRGGEHARIPSVEAWTRRRYRPARALRAGGGSYRDRCPRSRRVDQSAWRPSTPCSMSNGLSAVPIISAGRRRRASVARASPRGAPSPALGWRSRDGRR